ncbi:MAG: carbonic anhydrase [Alphaproteobacteria bacterium]|nr:carbonic anhydrase [Alphaproteobacteria bacterium]
MAAAGVMAPALAQEQRGKSYLPRPVPVKDGYADISPDAALELLKEGNEAFLAGRQPRPDFSSGRRLELAEGQAPFVAYVTCSDSRVAPELLFGRGLGELFIIRNAGNTIDTVALGSVEYAVAVLHVPLVVVMGHESCGAVKAAMRVVAENAHFPGTIGQMIEPIIPAVLEARDAAGDPMEAAVRQNVRRQVRQLRERANPLMLDPQKAGTLKVVGAYYNFKDGRVEFFDRP